MLKKSKANGFINGVVLIMISSTLLIVIFATENGVERESASNKVEVYDSIIERRQTQIWAYIPTPTIEPAPTMELPDKNAKKTYMDYREIKRLGSRQLELQQKAWTDEQGFRRIHDYYMVAMGTYYGTVGDKFIITLSRGSKIKAIMGDIKANQHTDEKNQYHLKDGSIVEFIIDKEVINEKIIRSGDCSHIIGFGIESIRRE